MKAPSETFPALAGHDFLFHGFSQRVPGLDVNLDREQALAGLDQYHRAALPALPGGAPMPLITGQQIHGREVAVVTASSRVPVPGVDGLLTNEPGVCLGIYVADCCAIYLVDPQARAIGLLHSGRKGTELAIATHAIAQMVARFGCEPSRMTAQLSPCIRPPHYETDFAAEIVRQCRQAGIEQVFDCGTCTASHPEFYYSYRRELGKTGRMLATLALLT